MTGGDNGGLTIPSTAVINDWQTSVDPINPQVGYQLPIGEAGVDLFTGGLILGQPLDFDQSPGTSVGGDPALVYDSSTVGTRATIEASFPYIATGSTHLTRLVATLTWNNEDPEAPVVVNVGSGLPDTGVTIDLPISHPVGTGNFPYTIDVVATLSDGTSFTASTQGTAGVIGNGYEDPVGYGWSIAGIDQLIQESNGMALVYGSGGSHFFADDGQGGFTSPPDDFGTLTDNGDGTHTYTAKDQTEYDFDAHGLLTSVATPDGQTTTYEYDSDQHLTQITTPDLGVTTFNYSGSGGDALLTSIDEPGGRTVALAQDSNRNLTSITDAAGQTRTFTYDSNPTDPNDPRNHLLIADQWQPFDTTFTYQHDTGVNNVGVVTAVNLGLGSVYQVRPVALDGWPVSDPEPGSVTDALGHATTYTLDSNGYLVELDRPDGASETWDRDSHELVTSATDFNGETTTYDYDSSGDGDLTEVDYPDGSSVSYQYDPHFHEVTQEKTSLGETTSYQYDSQTGDLTEETDPEGNTTTYDWSDGELMSMTDADQHTTTYGYDAEQPPHGNDRWRRTPDGLQL